MTTVLYHYAVTSLHKLITKTDLCLWDLILVFGIWSLSLESDPCIWNLILVFGIISGFLLVGVSMSDQFCCLFTCQMFWWLEFFFLHCLIPDSALLFTLFFSLSFFLSLHSTHREKAGGVFKEGLQPAQTSLHSSFSGGKICCCHEETAVWWVILHINLLLFLRMLLTISHKKPTFNGRAQKNSYTCSF